MRMWRAVVLAAVVVLSACVTAPGPGQLPTVELAPKAGPANQPWFAIFITGDGGWRKIDGKVSDVLRHEGIPVVGLLSNHYFAKERTPEESAADIDQLIREYSAKWNRSRVILVGYSRGADALPIIINKLPVESRSAVAVVALLGPALHGSLWIKGPDKYPLVPELFGLRTIPLVCVYGTREKESLCRTLRPAEATLIAIKGGHHFGGDYNRIGHAILEALKTNG